MSEKRRDDHAVRVLLVGAVVPPRSGLAAPVRALAVAGADVRALFLNPPNTEVLEGLPMSTQRRLTLTRWTTLSPPPRYTIGWWVQSVSYRIQRVANVRASAGLRILRAARRDPQARVLVDEADVLVALDRLAVYPVWRMSKTGDRPAFYGPPAAVRYVRSLCSVPSPLENSVETEVNR